MKHKVTLNALRSMMSAATLHGHDAYAVAEKQAHKFLRLAGCQTPSDISPAIANLPKVKIDIRPNLPVSGAVEWVQGYWQILINADEPPTRQRFSLAHELKHMIDHAFIPIDIGASHEIHDAQPARNNHHESVCDYFAGCVLVPRPWLKAMWASGTQDTDELARVFGVSRLAMTVRLSQTGLRDTPPAQVFSVEQHFAQAFTQRRVAPPRRIYRRAKRHQWDNTRTRSLTGAAR